MPAKNRSFCYAVHAVGFEQLRTMYAPNSFSFPHESWFEKILLDEHAYGVVLIVMGGWQWQRKTPKADYSIHIP